MFPLLSPQMKSQDMPPFLGLDWPHGWCPYIGQSSTTLFVALALVD